MEIVNSNKIKSYVITIVFITIILIIIPLVFYFSIFKYGLSEDKTDWGTFGDYFGGIVGTLLNLVAVAFSLFSIYITLKVAMHIHENEQKFNSESVERENKKTEREVQLMHLQNRPFPIVDFNQYLDRCEVTLTNQGPGVLIVKKWEIIYNGETFKNFGELIKTKLFEEKYARVLYLYDRSVEHIVSPNGIKNLLDLNARDVNQPANPSVFDEFNEKCKAALYKTQVKLFYEDIFENKFEVVRSLE